MTIGIIHLSPPWGQGEAGLGVVDTPAKVDDSESYWTDFDQVIFKSDLTPLVIIILWSLCSHKQNNWDSQTEWQLTMCTYQYIILWIICNLHIIYISETYIYIYICIYIYMHTTTQSMLLSSTHQQFFPFIRQLPFPPKKNATWSESSCRARSADMVLPFE